MSQILHSKDTENVSSRKNQKKKVLNAKNRKSLHEIQLNIQEEGKKEFTIYKDENLPPTNEKRKVFLSESETQTEKVETVDTETQTRLGGDVVEAAEAEAFMYTDTGDEEYWRELAEKRGEALDESLHENETLYVENCDLKLQLESLRKNLEEAEQAVAIAKELLDEDPTEKHNGEYQQPSSSPEK